MMVTLMILGLLAFSVAFYSIYTPQYLQGMDFWFEVQFSAGSLFLPRPGISQES